MRKSSAVPLTILATLSLFATGCHDAPESRNCVDAQGRIVPDTKCAAPSSSGTGFHYIYGGSSGGRVGDAVVGGSTTPSESGVSRGGFGHGGDSGGE
jgi:hypothetical protein